MNHSHLFKFFLFQQIARDLTSYSRLIARAGDYTVYGTNGTNEDQRT